MTATVVKLAVLAVVGIGSLFWLAGEIGQLRGAGGLFASTYDLEVEFRDATGLVAGDEVRLAGVRIGQVDAVRVERGVAVVTLKVDDGVTLPSESTFELGWRNLLGQRYVQAVPPDGPPGELLADSSRVPVDRTRDAADLAALVTELEPILGSLDTAAMNRVMHGLADVMNSREAEVGQTLDAAEQLVTRLAGRADRLGSTVEALAGTVDSLAQRDHDVIAALDALATTSEALAGQSGDLGDAVADTGAFVAILDEVLAANQAQLDTAIGQLDDLGGTLAARPEELSEGLRTLPWTSAALIRATNSGDWLNIYGRGFGLINTYYPPTRIGPDYQDVGPDDTHAPDPLLGQPTLPLPPLGGQFGPVTITPDDCTDCEDSEQSFGLEQLLAHVAGGGS